LAKNEAKETGRGNGVELKCTMSQKYLDDTRSSGHAICSERTNTEPGSN